MRGFRTLVEALCARASCRPDGLVYTFLREGDAQPEELTAARLDRRARAVAAEIERQGARGEPVLLLFPPGLDFAVSFFGCLYAGAIAVPAYPPRPNRPDPRLTSIVQDARPRLALTTAALLERLAPGAAGLPGMRLVAADRVPEEAGESWSGRMPDGGDLAFLQYTSGSTSAPRGVMISHANLVHNEEGIRQAFRQAEASVVVSWLPLYHDMGLIGGLLQPLYSGGRCVLMSPTSFLQKPLRWLEAVSRYRATTSGGPNFAYELCVAKVSAEERQALDLSSWSVAFNGAEPVRAETLERFAAAFGPCGFRREAFYPCYGLAEATLFVTGGRVEAAPVVSSLDAASLERNEVRPAGGGAARSLVSCGSSWAGHEVAVVDPETREPCAPERVGEIWVSGPSVARGYWNRDEGPDGPFAGRLADGCGPYLRTGDLGFRQRGELYVTGRLKDLIILRGRNHYPQDLERTAERAHPVLRPGCGAAFSVDAGGQERLVLVYEVERSARGRAADAADEVRRAIAEEHEVQVYDVVLLRTTTIPKTSSGKIQRRLTRRLYLEDGLEVVERSALREEEPGSGEAPLAGADLLGAPPAERAGLLTAFLRQRLARVLRRHPDEIGTDRPLGVYGLDSLAALELKQEVESALGASPSISGLLGGASLDDLAEELLGRVGAPADGEPTLAGEGPFALSPGQRALWFLHRLAPESAAYNLAGAARVRGRVEPEALRQALRALAERHPALRTVFEDERGTPRQRVRQEAEAGLIEWDASDWREEEVEERVAAEAWCPFDLEAGPLLRTALFRRPGGDRIVLAVHHIVADLWSVSLLLRELGALYTSFRRGEPAPAFPPASGYAELVARQAERLAGPRGEELWGYWSSRLAGAPVALDLPADRPRPAAQSFRGAAEVLWLDPELSGRIAALARAEGATLFMVALAAFQALLGRATGRTDFLVGSPSANRGRAELAGAVGYFVNPLVLRADLAGDPGFREAVARVRGTALEAFEHEGYPFPLLAERLQAGPIFQVLFVLQRPPRLEEESLGALALGEPGARLRLGDLELESTRLRPVAAQFDLSSILAWVAGRLGISFQYATDLFDPATVGRMLGHFGSLLKGAVSKPGARLSELPLLTQEEREQLRGWNDTSSPCRTGVCLHDLVGEQVERSPEAVAVEFEDESLTYRGLWERASALAGHLRSLGVNPEERVGVFAERSPDLPVALLAVLRAGGAYVPLDPSYPADRLSFMSEDAGLRIVLCQQRLLSSLPAQRARVVVLEEAMEGSGGEDLPRVEADYLAYVIYTSGSTGRPKGVMNTHRGIVNRLLWMQEVYGLQAGEGVLQKTPASFDVSVWELLWPLLVGARLVLARPGGHQDPKYLADAIESARISTVHFVPAMLRAFVESGEAARCGGLQRVIASGEALPQDLVDRWTSLGLPAKLHNLYGPTEAAVDVTFWPCSAGEPTVPIGRPVANTRMHVMDAWFHQVPVGVSGELCIGGVQVARGYLGRAELTAERFLPDPFADEPGTRLYRTGDLGRWRTDGALEYLGRLDHQVKLRGVRIELGEIEAVLGRHASVRECAVVVREHCGDPRIVAYLAGRSGQALDPEELRCHLSASLPESMMPSVFVKLEALPLTASGKVDRKALPEPEWIGGGEGRVAPRTPVEELLAGIFREVLGLKQVGVQDGFFHLGGHSLLATQVVSRVREAFGVELPLRALFEAPTVAGLAGWIETKLREGTGLYAPPIIPGPLEGELPLSFAQQRLWFLDQLEPGSPLYNVAGGFRLRGPLSEGALEGAFQAVARRHATLRTRFVSVEGRPAQVVGPEPEVGFARVDLGFLPAQVRAGELERLAVEEARHPFDLAQGPLLRVRVVKLGTEDHGVLVSLHHIVSDAWSLEVLAREVAALYQGRSLPPLPVQYADFARWQRAWLSGEVLEAQLAWWRARLAGAPELLDLPTDRPRSALASPRGGRIPVALPGGLDALARRLGATPFMVLLAAFQALLGRYARQEDVTVGSPIANRNRLEVEGMIGFFVNTLVLRADLSGDPAFAGLLAQVRETALGAYAHQDLPFERLVEELAPERSLDRTPLFQAMLVLQDVPVALELPGLGSEPLEADPGTAKFELTLLLERGAGGLRGWLEHRGDLFERTTTARLAGHLVNLFVGAFDAPDRRLSELSLLSAAERHQVIAEWLGGPLAGSGEARLHDLVEAQVERTPEAEALLWDGGVLTYAELDRRSNRLARRLARLGVGPEVAVGVCVERSPEMVVALLAVLKAGGAYVPLDPRHPAQRLAHLLEETGAPVVLTQEELRDRLPAATAEVVCLPPGGELSEEVPERLESGAVVDNLAYVIYTSGSTGRPKGVAIAHRSAAALLRWAGEAFSDAELEGVLASTSISFDLSVFELWVPLSRGGCVVLAGTALDLPRLRHRERVTLVNTVPSAMAELVRTGGLPASVRTVNLAGEALPRELARQLHSQPRVERLLNLYGPSEDTTYSTAEAVREESGAPAIGRPLPGSRIHLLDPAGTPVPAGLAGEIWIGGTGLARGYLKRPDLTAERFLPDPFGGAGERLYRTGDLGRYLPDGRIGFLGRLDHQVKVRGFRIELGEVEALLLAHPRVHEAVAVASGQRLIAYVGAKDIRAEELLRQAREWLPEPMVPSALVVLKSLPRTPNGKVDRKALPEPDWSGGGEGWVAPRTSVEELLAGIFREVLGLGEVGVRDGFFRLGGHSLLATQVVSRVREAFGVELPLRALFEAPTVAGLAERVEAALREGTGLPAPPIVPGALEGELPLSFAQQRLWFLDQLEPGSPLYNVAGGFRLRGPVSAGALEGAFLAVARRHAALRTHFVSVEGRPAQVVVPEPEVGFARVDLGSLPAQVRAGELERLAVEEARRPFDLARGPLLRVRVVKLWEEDHSVLVSLHHIVSDAWSLGVLAREVAALYEGRSLPPLPVQYADFARWQRAWLSGEPLEARLAWWRERLAGAPELLDLPTDRPRPAVAGPGAGRVQFAWPELLRRDLDALARRLGATPFMVLLAAFQALLGRYARQQDVTVGSPIANRSRLETEGLIGFFVNTLALRADLSGDPTFADLLAQARETALGAYTHQDLPFERLVEELAPERSLDRTPLFQAMLVLQDAPAVLELPGLRSKPLEPEAVAAKFDLTLFLEGGRLAGSFLYRRDLFDAPSVRRLEGHLRTLLETGVADPGRAVPELPMMSGAERQAVLVEWAGDRAEWTGLACLHELFEEQAARTPEALAVLFDGSSLTYRELDERSNRLARHLRVLGVEAEVRVGVLLERGPDLLVALLGILKAGGAYLPLDPAHPRERLAFLVRDTGLRLVLAEDRLAGRLPEAAAEVLRLDRDGDRIAWRSAVAVRAKALPGSAAYVLYTSGSTGRPKGVVVSHAAIRNRILWGQSVYPLGPCDRVLQSAGLSFDFSVWELFAPLLAGACVVLPLPGEHQDSAALARLIAAEGVSIAHFVPSLFQAFLDEPAAAQCRCLRTVFCGGEALTAELRERFFALLDARLFNQYGPTEATVDATFHVCERGGRPVVPIGRPVANMRTLLLDPRLQPVPPGVPGELFLGGPGLARGYLGRPDLTAGRFLPDDWSGAPGERLYRTGDLAVHLADGNLHFLGRLDQQVKLRGQRVELGEVEAILLRHPAVREAVVVASGGRLAAYVVPRPGAAPLSVELREHLQGFLPDSMIPSAFACLEALPLTPGGKLDRQALPEPEWGSGAGALSAPPCTPAEELVAGVFAEVLGLEQAGSGSDFFALGGHSLLATQAASRLRALFGMELPLRRFFEDPSVAGVARAVETARRRGVAAPPIRPAASRTELPLSFAQERLWFLHQMEPGSPRYNIPAAARLGGRLDVAALAASLREVVRRHEALRTSFRVLGGRPAQVIAPAAVLELPVADLGDLPAAEREAAARRRMEAEAGRPFDLAEGPLARGLLLRLGDEDWLLVFTLHHIVADGWSIGVLLRELGALYGARLEGRPSPLPELPVQYGDFAVWQRAWLTGDVLEGQLAWWRQRLEGAPPLLELPTDRPRAAVQSARGRRQATAFAEPLREGLAALCRRRGATLFMALLAGFQALLARYSGQEDLLVGSPVANRNRVETEGLIGFFVNTLVLRTDLAGDPEFGKILGRVREAALDAYDHQDVPFEKLVEELRPQRSLSHAPLFQAVLALQNAPLGALELPGLTLSPVEAAGETAKFDLTLVLMESGPGLAGWLEHNRDLFDDATARRLLDHLGVLLEGAVTDPALRLSELALLSGAERRQLAEWVGGPSAYPRDAAVHELFAAQAVRTPDAVAVEFGAAEITYAELERRARQVAWRLREWGVTPGTLVGIGMHRSPELVVAELGVLMAGGAYVPLNPGYPLERLAWMLEDTGAPVVLTREEDRGPMSESARRLPRPPRVAGLEEMIQGTAGDLGPAVGGGHLAYVLYTSGSTGRPKGVGVPHRAIARLVLDSDYVRFEPRLRVAQVSNPAFDAATFEIWGALLSGARLVGIPREVALTPAALAAELRARRIDVLFLTTALFNQIAAEAPEAFSSVESLLVGGEAADPASMRRVLERGAPRRLLNAYGPTESTTFASWHLVEEVSAGAVTVPIGRPISNTSLHILDRALRPVPIGVIGEVFLGGDGLALGYLGRPALTAGRFVPHPETDVPGERLYRTGDRARRGPDGAVEYVGRLDNQVKIRGFRIEPGEIEAALVEHPGVREALVLAVDSGSAAGSDRRLAAYVVPAEGAAPSSRELRSYLEGRLPAYMVPGVFLSLQAFPLNSNGKVDRSSLPAPDGSRPDLASHFQSPRTPLEREIVAIWCEVLGCREVGVDDDFFELGGHSLLATRLLGRYQEALGVTLPLRRLFEAPTVAELAEVVESARREQTAGLAIGPISRKSYGVKLS